MPLQQCTGAAALSQSAGRLLLVVCIMTTMLCHIADAQETYSLEEVVVTADQDNEMLSGAVDATGFATVIRTEDLPANAITLPEVLNQTVGVTVKQSGGPGSFSTASIRGSSAEQVAVYLDGVLLNKAAAGVVNLADVPLDNVEKIEIYRGTSPAKFAFSGIGGVINIITKKAQKALDASAGYSFGSFGTHKANAFSSVKKDKTSGVLLYSHMQSEGDFSYLDTNGTDYKKDDDKWTHRRNNDFTSDNVIAKAGYLFSNDLQLDVQTDLFKKHEGVPGIGSYQSRKASLLTLRSLSTGTLICNNFMLPGLAAECGFSYSFQRQQFRDPLGEIGLAPQDTRDDTNNYTARLLLSYQLKDMHKIALLLEASRETYESLDRLATSTQKIAPEKIGYLYGFTENTPDSRDGAQADTQKRYAYTAGLEDEICLLNKLLITPSVKLNHYKNDFAGTLPYSSVPLVPADGTKETHLTRKLGLGLYATDFLQVKSNIGKYYRVPAFYELFGDRGAVVGNTNLKAEEGVNGDIGFSFEGSIFPAALQSCAFEYAYFFNNADNLIIFIQNSQRTFMAQNISKARIRGHEFFWRMRLKWPILLSGNYTIEDARDRSDIPYWRDNQLPGRPEQKLFNRIELCTRGWSIFHEIEFMRDNYLDRANTKKIDNRIFHNAGISFTPAKKITFTFEVKNLTDRHSEDIAGYPLPGRSFTVGVERHY